MAGTKTTPTNDYGYADDYAEYDARESGPNAQPQPKSKTGFKEIKKKLEVNYG